MSGPRVTLHVDRLVLRGIPRGQREALVGALRDELARQLATPAFREGLCNRHLASVATTPLAGGEPSGARLGRQSARLIAKGIRG